ncbi:hypothetical protein HDU76_013904 [Blyttiomyces sp. JEL0837]|nr:hypothetical protein HDU76_013904 [Blyttiomyces sp. JEL0837]
MSSRRPALCSGKDDPDAAVLNRIHMRYTSSDETLRAFIESLPTSETPLGTPQLPFCIIIDDFSSFFSQSKAT